MLTKQALIFLAILCSPVCHAVDAQQRDTITNDYWHTLWKEKDTGWDQKETNPFLIKYFSHFHLKPGATFFVPLSGKSIDMLWLANKGYQVIGIEINLEACQLFFKENHIPYKQSKKGKFHILKSEKITLFVGDFFDLDKATLGPIDAIYDRAALIALPLETQRRYAQKMISLMDPHTQMMLMTCEYDTKEMKGPPFSVNEKEVQALFGKRFSISRLYEGSVETIPAHLSAKGLKHLQEAVFYLAPTL